MISQWKEFPFRELSIEERILLIEEIWDSIDEDQAGAPLTEAQRALLEERLADYQANPADVFSWEEVKERLAARIASYRSHP